jgi:hypothetical protein
MRGLWTAIGSSALALVMRRPAGFDSDPPTLLHVPSLVPLKLETVLSTAAVGRTTSDPVLPMMILTFALG